MGLVVDPLQALGATPVASTVYAGLVEHGPATIDDLAARFDAMGCDEVMGAVDSLEHLGLVVIADGMTTAMTPRTALESIGLDHARQASKAREAADHLAAMWSLYQGRADYIEIVPTMAGARKLQTRVFTEATSQIRALSIGSDKKPRMAEGLADVLQSPVQVRSIYGTQVLDTPEALEVVGACIDLGEQSRVFPKIPVNLLICDDRFAMMVVRVASPRRADGLVIYRSDLLDTAIGVFEAFWNLAVPVALSHDDLPSLSDAKDTRRLLTYLAAGMTDMAIAADFDVSERTVRRRITELRQISGVQTRFQLGIQAVRRGWL